MSKQVMTSIYSYFRAVYWTIIFVYLSPSVYAAQEGSFVTCRLGGQLGNQLFEVAATLSYAWDYGVTPFFPELHGNYCSLSYNKDRIFFRLNANSLPRPYKNFYQEPFCYSEQRIPFKPDQYLLGFFQSWAHFHHHRDKLLQVFAPHVNDEMYLQAKYADLINHPSTVAVHIRTLDEINHNNGYMFLGMDYYERAMNLFPEHVLFVVFSDRINWCKHHLSHLQKNMIFIEGNDHVQDLFLMSKMKHHIIANSTFSWWAAYLCQHPNQVVIAPRFWVHPRTIIWPPGYPNYFYLPHWQMLEFNFNLPYPTDIRAYDSFSQSIDTQ